LTEDDISNRVVQSGRFVLTAFFLASTTLLAQPAPTALLVDPAKTSASITLDATLHTVHGKFLLRRGDLRFDPVSGKISGEIIFDATTGKTGNDGRDHKMHKDVLESAKFPDISFRPDRVEGKISDSGTSTVQVHGRFAIHGTEHELTVPVEVRFERDHWKASTHFDIPYVKWGMKNPSNLFLHVGDSVRVEFEGEGALQAPSFPRVPDPRPNVINK
jgi:polyisoprenoid-binding protein YceI